MTDKLEESSRPGRPGFFVQTLMVGPVLYIVVMLWFFNASAAYDGLLSLIGWSFAAAYYSVLTICIVFVAGLPLRLSWRARAWWVDRWWLAIAGMALGLVVIVVGSIRGGETFVDDTGYRDYVDGVNFPLSVVGWFILAFCLMHTWWPARGSRARRAVTPA